MPRQALAANTVEPTQSMPEIFEVHKKLSFRNSAVCAQYEVPRAGVQQLTAEQTSSQVNVRDNNDSTDMEGRERQTHTARLVITC